MFKKIAILTVLLVLCGFSFLFGVIFEAYTLPTSLLLNSDKNVNLNSDRLITLVQDWRVENKLSMYKGSDTICNMAKIRIYEIKKNFSHEGFWYHTKDFNHQSLAENIAKDYPTEEETLKGWINSPAHLENLKKNYEYSCVATDGTYAVQIFANL